MLPSGVQPHAPQQPSEAAYGSSGRPREVGAILHATRCLLPSFAYCGTPPPTRAKRGRIRDGGGGRGERHGGELVVHSDEEFGWTDGTARFHIHMHQGSQKLHSFSWRFRKYKFHLTVKLAVISVLSFGLNVLWVYIQYWKQRNNPLNFVKFFPTASTFLYTHTHIQGLNCTCP